jgi:hypothetical protein
MFTPRSKARILYHYTLFCLRFQPVLRLVHQTLQCDSTYQLMLLTMYHNVPQVLDSYTVLRQADMLYQA